MNLKFQIQYIRTKIFFLEIEPRTRTSQDDLQSCYCVYQVGTFIEKYKILIDLFLALRSIGLKSQEHLFFINIIGDNGDRGLDNHLFDLLEGAIKN